MQCRLCNAMIGDQGIAWHLLKLHNKKYQDYVEEVYNKYPNDFTVWKRCVICKKLSKHKTCSPEHGIQLRKIKFPNGTHFGCKNTKEAKKNMRNAQLKYYKTHTSNRLGTHHTEETKRFLSEQAITEKLHAGKNNGMYGKTHTPEAVRKIFSYRRINKLEQIVFNKLTEAGIKFTFQYSIETNNICKFYDFKIKNKPIIIEVDGDWWHGNPNCKGSYVNADKAQANDRFKEKLAESKGFKVIRFWESDIKRNPNIIVETLNGIML
jgi:very-short-patch-repair endonuclease